MDPLNTKTNTSSNTNTDTDNKQQTLSTLSPITEASSPRGIEIVGQEPPLLSPIDRDPSQFSSSIAGTISPPDSDITSPRQHKPLTLPLPASSSLLSRSNTLPSNTSSSPPPDDMFHQRVTTPLAELPDNEIKTCKGVMPTPLELQSHTKSNSRAETDPLPQLPSDPALKTPKEHSMTDGVTSSSSLTAGGDYMDYESLEAINAQKKRRSMEVEKIRKEKFGDPAVLYDIPATPSAQAYEIMANAENNAYFSPEFPANQVQKDGAAVVEGVKE